MSREPVEVEVLDKDGTPAIPEKRVTGPLSPIINTLAAVFAVLTALMILLIALAATLAKQDDESPPDPE